MPESADRLFGKAVLKAGYATQSEVESCLAQLRPDAPGKRLPDILLERGILSPKQVAELLRGLRAFLADCPSCGRRRYLPLGSDPRRLCSNCRQAKEKGRATTPPPTQVAYLRILRRLAGDAESGVYKAFHTALDRIVALKLFSPEVVASRRDDVLQALKGARVAARLDHPNIVRVFNVGIHEGWHFVEMEYVDGLPLSQILRARKVIPVDEAADIVRQVGKALQAIHEMGLVHGDVRPEKILVRKARVAKLTGFGRSGGVGAAKVAPDASLDELFYTPPEALRGEALETRSDIYSLGMVLFRAVTGRLPFETANRVELIKRQCLEDPPDPCEVNHNVPRMVGDIILRMLSKYPAGRFAGAAAFVAALDSATAGRAGPRLGQLRRGDIQALYPITAEPLVIGRGPECSIVVRDERTSRRHARVFLKDREIQAGDLHGLGTAAGAGTLALRGREVIVEDLKSRNGTRVNGEKVLSRVLVPGDVLRIGREHFVYLVPGMPVSRGTRDAVGWLHGTMTDGSRIELPVTELPLLIGAMAEANLPIKSAGVPDIAAQVVATPRGVRFTDLTADLPEPVSIVHGAAITIGPVRLSFSQSRRAGVPGGEAPDAPPPFLGPAEPGGPSLLEALAAEAERLDKLAEKPAGRGSNVASPAVRGATAHLTARSGPREGQTFPLGTEEVLIGSNKECAIHLTDPGVSARHARIVFLNGDFVVEDLGGGSGVRVNGQRVRRQALKPGDTLRIGASEFLMHL